MNKPTYAVPHPRSFVELLEGRTFLSASLASAIHADLLMPRTHVAIHVSRHSARLGQSITISAKVTAAKKLGAIDGNIQFLNHGVPIQALGSVLELPLDAKGRATYGFGVGNIALFAGKNAIRVAFVSSNALPNSTSNAVNINVKVPRLKAASDGLQSATVGIGRGPGAVAGQTANILYTGFLAADATIFDYSSSSEPAGFGFPIEASPEQVISGVDQGILGMKVGETRILAIPASLGYGSTGQGPIPPNADLVFFMKLISLT